MTKQQFTVHEVEITSTNESGRVSTSGLKSAKQKSKTYSLDLKIHSPVALGHFGMDSVDTLPALVRLAKNKGLDVISVTDFYSGQSVDRIKKAAEGSNLIVIPGVDIRAAVKECNDIQLTCLFSESQTSEQVGQFLNELNVPPQASGRSDFIVPLELGQILEVVDRHGGACFPSRMDKTPGRMGAIPVLVEKYGFRAFDLAYTDSSKFFQLRWPKMKFHLFSFSNANALAQVGSRSARVKLEAPDFESLKRLVTRAR